MATFFLTVWLGTGFALACGCMAVEWRWHDDTFGQRMSFFLLCLFFWPAFILPVEGDD